MAAALGRGDMCGFHDIGFMVRREGGFGGRGGNAPSRHCEERSDAAIQKAAGAERTGLLRRKGSRNDEKLYPGPIVSFTLAINALSANGFAKNANCSFSGRLFSKASSA